MTGFAAPSSGQVTVERLICTYVVGRDHPAPEGVRSHLDALAREEIALHCRRLLPAVLDPDDPSVWFVRRLDLDLTLDLSVATDDLVARSWSQQIVDGLAEVLVQGPRGDQVVRFADRAEYLASFARELARGNAWNCWYFSPFAGVRSLPPGRAFVEILAREPDLIEEVVLRLDRWGELGAVFDRLTDGDAETVLRLWAQPEGDGVPSRQGLDAMLAIWPVAQLRGPRSAGARNVLHLYALGRRHAPAAGYDANLSAAIDLLLHLAGMLASTRDRLALVDAIALGDLGAAAAMLRESGAGEGIARLPRVIQVCDGDRSWMVEVARVLAPPGDGPERNADSPGAMSQTAISAFGGIFLLWPVLIDLQLHTLLAGIPPPDSEEDESAALLRHLLAVACFGRERAVAAVLDPVLAGTIGLDRPPTFEALERAAATITAATSETCMRFLAGALARQGRIDGRRLAADLVSLPSGGDVLLLRDTAHDDWLCAAPLGDECGSLILWALAISTEAADIRPTCLLVGEALDQRLEGKAPAGWPEEIIWLRPGALEPAGDREALAGYRSRVHPALDDLLYLSLAGLHPLTVPAGHADLTFCLLARALLRGLASRLLGFEWSSCAYLYRNFLAGISTVRYQSDRIEVELARPPLHVILSLGGAGSQMYEIPWLDGAAVTLSLAPD